MVYKRNELRLLVEAVLSESSSSTIGLSCKELAQRLNRKPSHVNQILRTLAIQGKVHYELEKRSLDRATRFFKPKTKSGSEKKIAKAKTCGSCQWLSSIQRCTLLDLAFEANPSLLPQELRKRVKVTEIPRETAACPYFDPWVPGQLMSKQLPKFIKENSAGAIFLCPIERCRKGIGVFSLTLQKIPLGSNTFYCPHCGCPMEFGYDEQFDDYRVYYWDSHYDILQKSFHELTGDELPERNPPEQNYGLSILKEGSFTLRKKDEVILIGSKTTPEKVVQSPDLAYFPLRKLNYIYAKSWEDYNYLAKALHEVVPETNRPLYDNIMLYPPRESIPSVEPLEKEVGGNELIIIYGIPNIPAFRANLSTREAMLEKKLEFVDADLKELFKKALTHMKRYNRQFGNLKYLDFKEWQRYEGGCASMMVEPFKKEAQKYGYFTPSREKSRMVRSERFLPFGHYCACSAYDSLINGVNQVITSVLKKEIYNEIPFAWDGLRGWCHRRYSFGLYLDTIEQAKIIALFWIHEAIRNQEIKPSDFVLNRGKRYDPYFCVESNSETFAQIQKIGLQAISNKIRLISERAFKLKQAYAWYIRHEKVLLNKFANYSVELTSQTTSLNEKLMTLWKKLQQTSTKEILTSKELQQIHDFSREFFSKEFTYEPLTIVEVY